MNALAYKAHKQGMPHSDMHSISRPHYPTTMHPYISSSKFSVNWHATATYLCRDAWLLNNVAVLWSVYHCVVFLLCVLCQPVHSLIHPYIS